MKSDSADRNGLRIPITSLFPVTVCGFCYHWRNLTEHNIIMCLGIPLYVPDSANFGGQIQFFSEGIGAIPCFRVCSCHSKPYKTSKKESNVLDSSTNMLSICCRIHSHFIKYSLACVSDNFFGGKKNRFRFWLCREKAIKFTHWQNFFVCSWSDQLASKKSKLRINIFDF